MRKTSDVPILMLTARDEDVDKIIGLEVGADDYLTKPFNPRELVARVKSVLRRAAPERRRDEAQELRHGDLLINSGRREVKVGDDEIQLAPKEFDLLWELLDHKGLVLTRDQLLERVWGYTFAGDTRTVDVHVRQLRRKLGDASPIVTVWGVGYKVGPSAARRPRRKPTLAGVPLAAVPPDGPLPGGHRPRRARRLADRAAALPGRHARAVDRGAPARGAGALAALCGVGRRAERRGRRAPDFAAAKLEAATGDRLFYVGLNHLPGEDSGLEPLSERQIGRELPTTRATTFEFTLPARDRTFWPRTPLRLAPNTPPFGWLVVAKPETELRDSG